MGRVHVLLMGVVGSGCSAPLLDSDVPGTGYVDLTLDLAAHGVSPEAVVELTVGGLRAYDLRPDGDDLTFTVQGGGPGEAAVVATLAEGDVTLGTLTYAGPVDPLFDRFVAFGASLTQGTRDAVPTASAQLAGPAMQIARVAGAWLPLPLLADPLIPMEASDVAADCSTPDTVSFIVGGLLETLDRLVDPVTGGTNLALGRVTPEVTPHNVAVGNATVAFQRVGYDGRAEDVVAQMIGKLTLEPSGSDLFEPLATTPIQRVVGLDPTLVVSFDLWGNDIIYALFGGDSVDDITPVADVAAELEVQLELLDATGAVVILAALPDVTVLPGIDLTEEDRVAVQGVVAAYNQVARDAAATRDWLYIAPLDEVVANLGEGLEVGDARLTTDALGGLLSLDGLHFTDTGYAMAANAVLGVIRDELGVDVPDVDLGAVYATDIRTPAALAAAGVDPACLP